MTRRGLAPLALLAALGFASPVHAAGLHELGIEDVAQLAVASVPELQAARERAGAVEARSRSTRSRSLPSIHVTDEYQHWDGAFTAPFSLPGAPPFVVREADTNTFGVSAHQPVLGLLRGLKEYQAQALGADAATVGVKIDESALREAVELEYLRLFEAKARADIARASEQELAQEVNETAARVKAGTLTNADLLRMQVAQANARQQGIVADSDATVARANLLSVIGRAPDDTTTEFSPPTALLARADVPVPAGDNAVLRRPEVEQAKLRADAADQEESSRLFALLPDVDLEAAYSHVNGQVFAPKDSWFVGVKADWAIWEWGTTYAAKEAASAEARAAVHDIDAVRRKVRTEVTQRKAELGASASAVTLARQTIRSAEEAYRVTEAQVRAGVGTTTDLLNAESALSEARLRLENARYAQAAARIRLERATGAR